MDHAALLSRLATYDDTFDDLFPGSGIVAAAWQLYASRGAGAAPERDAS